MDARSTPSLKLLLKRQDDGAPPAFATGDAGDESLTASSHGRFAARPQLSIVFRKADGSGKGFAYSLFLGVEFDDPSVGFTINFSGCKVSVAGRNLEPVLRRVCEHRQAEIVEATERAAVQSPVGEPVIEGLRFLS